MNGIKLEDDLQRNGNSVNQTCCLIDSGVRCLKAAGNASYSKRIQKTVQQRRLKLVVDQGANHIYICDMHKNTIQHLRNQQKARDSKTDSSDTTDRTSHTEVNFYLLPVNLLRRYKRHFKLATRPGINKAQLADIVAKHFGKLQVDEKEVLTYFLYTCKTNNRSGRLESSELVN